MSDFLLPYFLLFFFGFFCGSLYFWLLWTFVKKIAKRSHPIFFAITGFFLRLAMMAAALFYIANTFQIIGVLVFLAGFFVMRLLIEFRVKRSKAYENNT